MSKKTIGYSVGVVLIFIVVCPWYLPDSWCYVRKGTESVYVPIWDAWVRVSLTLGFAFAIVGIVSVCSRLNDFLSNESKDHEDN